MTKNFYTNYDASEQMLVTQENTQVQVRFERLGVIVLDCSFDESDRSFATASGTLITSLQNYGFTNSELDKKVYEFYLDKTRQMSMRSCFNIENNDSKDIGNFGV